MKDYQESLDRLVKGLYITKEEKQKRGKALQELVNKAIPMKVEHKHVVHKKHKLHAGSCKSCKTYVSQYDDDCRMNNYCPDCGQALKWNNA
jgi:formamidopyrimidine-DNA glycosylase